MTGIKICGITTLTDALFVAACGVDALGLIFHPRSPRYITPESARKIVEGLAVAPRAEGRARETILTATPDRITTVGVFVNEEIEKVREIADFCGFDLFQLHGEESPAYCRELPAGRVIKALALRTGEDLRRIPDYDVRAILVDAYDPVNHGGTGRTSNWDLAARAKSLAPLILSGGLHSGNIREALAAVRPDGVDINSGVEQTPGKKDHAKVKEIIDLIRSRP